jgi:S1-C subfamily serine protease
VTTPIDTLLLAAARVATFDNERPLTNASGFFFARDDRLYLVTSRHVVHDAPSGHLPSRIELEVHADPDDLGQSVSISARLYDDQGRAVWKQGLDSGGEIDVAVLQIDRAVLPGPALLHAFTPAHLQSTADAVQIGTPVLTVGFPLGFHDTLHHLPVARHSVIASAWGMRFQGLGYFLTDARTHRGSSGAPVVMSAAGRGGLAGDALPWKLLGVHSSRLDMLGRDAEQDESLGLNCAWYADVLMTLTQP